MARPASGIGSLNLSRGRLREYAVSRQSRRRFRAGLRKLRPAAPPGAGDNGAERDPGPLPDCSDASVMFAWCLKSGVRTRPQYLWPVLLGARIAKALGIPRVSVIEFGVAGGNGLLALETAADAAESLTGVRIDVVGFDSGTGMPEPIDHRDVPWVIRPGLFAMDEAALRARLRRATVLLGPVGDTLPAWLRSDPAPVAFASFDLDYYSSTMQAFGLLDAPQARMLPRIPCYFDDIFGYGWSDFNGERAAIADFNAGHAKRKIGPIYGLQYELPASEAGTPWPSKMFLVHLLDHQLYNTPEGELSTGWSEALRLQPEQT